MNAALKTVAIQSALCPDMLAGETKSYFELHKSNVYTFARIIINVSTCVWCSRMKTKYVSYAFYIFKCYINLSVGYNNNTHLKKFIARYIYYFEH